MQYQDYGYKRIDSGSGLAGEALSSIIVSIINDLNNVRTICDLGCGNGYLAGRLLSHGFKVTGVDGSTSGIQLARQQFSDTDANFYCELIDNELPNKLTCPFDLVVSSDVVEHLYEPQVLFRCAYELLKPNGYLVIGTPYHGYLKNLALSFLNKWDAHHGVEWVGGHIKFFSKKSLSVMVENAGFAVDSFHVHGRAPLLWKNMIIVAKKVPQK